MNIIKITDKNFENLWNVFFKRNEFTRPFYSTLFKEYQKEYLRLEKIIDVSFLVCDKNIAVAGICVSVSYTKNIIELSNFGLPLSIYYLENSYKSEIIQKVIIKEIEDLILNYKINRINYLDLLIGGYQTELTNYFLSNNSILKIMFTRILEIDKDINILHEQIRKSYKSLINWGKKNLDIKILNSKNITIDEIKECNKLHINAAGIETRSFKTWEVQYNQILNNELFAVTGKMNGELVTFGFFPYNNKYCFYGVSASKRELFDKPLSHSIIWRAVEYAKQIGCMYFELGGHYFKSYDNDITEKELNIGVFKRGFGGTTKVLFNIFVNK